MNDGWHDIPATDYHAMTDYASRGALVKLIHGESPAEVRWWLDNPEGPLLAYEVGTMTHTCLLQPDEYERVYHVPPEFTLEGSKAKTRKNGGVKEDWDAFKKGPLADFDKEHNFGLELGTTVEVVGDGDEIRVSKELKERVEAMCNAVREHRTGGLLSHDAEGGEIEQTVIWHDKIGDLPCRCRPDIYFEDIGLVMDLKTTNNVAAFEKSVANYGYHYQAAFYLRGLKAIGKHVNESLFLEDDLVVPFLFVVVGKTEPYPVRVVGLSKPDVDRAMQDLEWAMGVMAECYVSGEWPGYDSGVDLIGNLPNWAFRLCTVR